MRPTRLTPEQRALLKSCPEDLSIADWREFFTNPNALERFAKKYDTGNDLPLPRQLLRDPLDPNNTAYLRVLLFHEHPLVDVLMLRFGLLLDRLVRIGRTRLESFFTAGEHTPEEFRNSYASLDDMAERHNLRLKELYTAATIALIEGFRAGDHLPSDPDDDERSFIYSLASFFESGLYQWLGPDGQPTDRLLEMTVRTRMLVVHRQLDEWLAQQATKPSHQTINDKLLEFTREIFTDLPIETQISVTGALTPEQLDFYRRTLGRETLASLAAQLGIRLPDDDDEEELILH